MAGPLQGAGTSLTKAGGSLTDLSNANTYTGITAVTGGTLLVNGSTAAASVVTVGPGATLAGTGTVAGPVSPLGTVGSGSSTSIGVLTAGGSYSQSGGGTLRDLEGEQPGRRPAPGQRPPSASPGR